jgi:hypothetical protein
MLRRPGREYDEEPTSFPPVLGLPPVRCRTKKHPFPLEPHLQKDVDDGYNLLVAMLARPDINFCPFYIAKTANTPSAIWNDAMNPFTGPTYPVWILRDPEAGITMPFRFPSINTRDPHVKKYFGETVKTLRYKVVSVVVNQKVYENSKDSFLVEFGLQARAGYSYGTLNQKVPAGGPSCTDEDYDDHCVVIHFYVGLSELILQGKAIPNPASALPGMMGRLGSDNAAEYMSAFREHWRTQHKTLVEKGMVPEDTVEYTRERTDYRTSEETRGLQSRIKLKQAAFRWGVSLDYYTTFVRPLLKARGLNLAHLKYSTVEEIDEKLHWHTKKDVKQVVGESRNVVTYDHLAEPGQTFQKRLQRDLSGFKSRLSTSRTVQTTSFLRFQIKYVQFQMKQIENEYSLSSIVSVDGATRKAELDIVKNFGEEGREMVQERQRAVVLYGETSEQARRVRDRIYDKTGFLYPENIGHIIRLGELYFYGKLTSKGTTLIHAALLKKRLLGLVSGRLGSTFSLDNMPQTEAEETTKIDNEIQQILKKYAIGAESALPNGVACEEQRVEAPLRKKQRIEAEGTVGTLKDDEVPATSSTDQYFPRLVDGKLTCASLMALDGVEGDEDD